MTVVDSNGDILTTSESEKLDLFWYYYIFFILRHSQELVEEIWNCNFIQANLVKPSREIVTLFIRFSELLCLVIAGL
jgi:hypothetical protein